MLSLSVWDDEDDEDDSGLEDDNEDDDDIPLELSDTLEIEEMDEECSSDDELDSSLGPSEDWELPSECPAEDCEDPSLSHSDELDELALETSLT